MTERPGDRQLWKPTDLQVKASLPENERVRALLVEELTRMVMNDNSADSTEVKWGHARGRFALEWVEFCERQGLPGPGADKRTSRQRDERRRRIDAGRARLRQFIEGHPEQAWVLTGIEATIADKRGLALPGAAYQVQGRLDVEGGGYKA